MSIDWLDKAQAQTVLYKDNEKFSAGIDVAGPGENETVLVVRRGGQIVKMKAWPQPDPRGEIVIELREFEGRLDYVNVDSCGIGYYLARHLEDCGLPVSDVNVGDSPDDHTRYVNLKAEAYWGLRMWFQAGDVGGISDDVALGQLASIRYKPNSRGQIAIESKEDAGKRGVASPDRAEAIMLAFARPRTHGLISYWEQLAEDLEKKKLSSPTQDQVSTLLTTSPSNPTPPILDRQSLADAQKDAYPRMSEHASLLKKTQRGKIQVHSIPQACPGCGNTVLSVYSEGAWACGGCGTKGIEHIVSVYGPGAKAGVLV
jgi:ribosomal protein S27AE